MKVIVKESQSVTFRRKIYEPGDEVDLPDKIAKHLIDTDVCAEPGKSVANRQSTINNQQSKGEKKDANKKMSNSR